MKTQPRKGREKSSEATPASKPKASSRRARLESEVTIEGNTVTINGPIGQWFDANAKKHNVSPARMLEVLILADMAEDDRSVPDEKVTLTIPGNTAIGRLFAMARRKKPNVSTADMVLWTLLDEGRMSVEDDANIEGFIETAIGNLPEPVSAYYSTEGGR